MMSFASIAIPSLATLGSVIVASAGLDIFLITRVENLLHAQEGGHCEYTSADIRALRRFREISLRGKIQVLITNERGITGTLRRFDKETGLSGNGAVLSVPGSWGKCNEDGIMIMEDEDGERSPDLM